MKSPSLPKFVKYPALIAAIVIIAMAFLNVRVGFGAQSVDCIDAFMSIVRFKTPDTIVRGQFVVFVAPQKMGNPFAGHLVIKKVGAVEGDKISIHGGELYINGEHTGKLDIADIASKKLKVVSFDRDELVPSGHVFLIGTRPRTYDSRYWGFVPVHEVVGRAYPLI